LVNNEFKAANSLVCLEHEIYTPLSYGVFFQPLNVYLSVFSSKISENYSIPVLFVDCAYQNLRCYGKMLRIWIFADGIEIPRGKPRGIFDM